MKIKININCCTIGELRGHITCLGQQIKKHQKLFNRTDNDELSTGLHITDSNCYGDHDLNVLDGDNCSNPIQKR